MRIWVVADLVSLDWWDQTPWRWVELTFLCQWYQDQLTNACPGEGGTISFKYKDNFPRTNKGQFQINMALSTSIASMAPMVSCDMESNTNPAAPEPWIQIWSSTAAWVWMSPLIWGQHRQLRSACPSRYDPQIQAWSQMLVQNWGIHMTFSVSTGHNINTEVALQAQAWSPAATQACISLWLQLAI